MTYGDICLQFSRFANVYMNTETEDFVHNCQPLVPNTLDLKTN